MVCVSLVKLDTGMSSTLSESRNAINADDSRREHPTPPPRSHTEVPANFVFGPTRTRSSSHQQNGSEPRYTGGIFAETSDSAHALSLLEQLSTDLGTLLNRVDISDCFLNVKGKVFSRLESIGMFFRDDFQVLTWRCIKVFLLLVRILLPVRRDSSRSFSSKNYSFSFSGDLWRHQSIDAENARTTGDGDAQGQVDH